MGLESWLDRPFRALPHPPLYPLSKGEEVLRQLQTLAPRGVKVRIAVSKPSGPQPQADLQGLQQSGELGQLGWAGLGCPSQP